MVGVRARALLVKAGREPQFWDDSWYAWITAAERRPACLTSRPCDLAQERIASARPAGAMVEVAFTDPLDSVGVRPDGLAVRVVRLAGVLFPTGVAEARPAGLAPLAPDTLASATSGVSFRRSPRWKESPLAPKAARTVANASSSESWRVSTVTFMVAPGSGWA